MSEDARPQAEGPRSPGGALLAARLREQKVQILERWETRARGAVPALSEVDAPHLRLGPAELLDQIASLLAGDLRQGAYGEIESAGARRHAASRQQAPGYSAVDVVTEYHLLREELVEQLAGEEGWSAGAAALVHARLDRAVRDVIQQLQAPPAASPLPGFGTDSGADAERGRDEASRAQWGFIYRIYRELRNPLLIWGGRAKILERPDVSIEQCQRFAAAVADMCGRKGELLEELMEAFHLLNPGWYCGRFPLDLAAVLEAARQEVQPLADEQQVTLAVTPPARRLLVRGDDRWLERAVVQLLRNAVEFSRTGGHIWLAAARQGNEAIIGVRDNGAGVRPSLLPRIFDPLVSDGRGRFPRLTRGWGLGLPMARRIVERHGGTLSAFSPGEDRGSDFVIRIPALPESVRPFRHVLLVRRQAAQDDFFAREFQHVGCAVQHVDSVESALAAVRQQRPEAVFIDFDRPAVDGVALARRLRELLQPQPPCLIALLSDLPFQPQPDLGDAFDRRAEWTGESEALRDLVLTDEGSD